MPASKMSTDRVVFQIPIKRLLDQRYVGCVMKAFGMTPADVPTQTAQVYRDCYTDVTWKVTCRPSQFARFLILRGAAGCQNMFSELKAQLIEAEPGRPAPLTAEPIDVSHRPKR